MNIGRGARTALVAPMIIAGGLLISTLASTDVLAASSSTTATTPQTSSKPHKHERVECSPGNVAEKHGQCAVVFVDPKTPKEPNPVGQKVCFSVTPAKAGHIGTGTGSCARIGKNDRALGTFTASGSYCGKATISALEAGKGEQVRHTTITIVCPKKSTDATTTAAFLPAGTPQPPIGGVLAGALGILGAIVAGFVLNRRSLAPWRLAAGKSA